MTDMAKGDEGIRRIRHRRGMISRIARELGMDDYSVGRWESVPINRVFQVARITGLDPAFLRPDFFVDDPLRYRQALRIRQSRAPRTGIDAPTGAGVASRI